MERKMGKREYDLAFGLGASCKATQSLREAQLQFLTFPLDWCGGPSLVDRAPLINSGFEGILARENMELQDNDSQAQNALYFDRRYGFLIIHEFHKAVPFDEELPRVQERFRRRCGRFLSLLNSAKRILVFWVNLPTAPLETPETMREFRRQLRAAHPNAEVDMLLLNHAEGISPGRGEDREAEGVRVVSFDYRNRNPRETQWVADEFIIGKWLRENYACVDYRTPAEIEAWRKKQATAKYDRFKAKNFADYIVTKLEYKLYRHLIKKMAKKGLA